MIVYMLPTGPFINQNDILRVFLEATVWLLATHSRLVSTIKRHMLGFLLTDSGSFFDVTRGNVYYMKDILRNNEQLSKYSVKWMSETRYAAS